MERKDFVSPALADPPARLQRALVTVGAMSYVHDPSVDLAACQKYFETPLYSPTPRPGFVSPRGRKCIHVP